MDILNKQSAPEINYTTATFKSTRILNGHSIERMPSGQLDVRISHRFGRINSGSLMSSIAVKTVKWADPSSTNYFSFRLSFVDQVLIARKINQRFSVQITPSFVHRNFVPTEIDPNDLWALGAGGRVKLSNRISLNTEYFYIVNSKTNMSQKIYDPSSLGFDIETGGHVFQLFFTNSVAMIEKGFIGETTGNWRKGDIHFGFNISRVFTLKRPPANPDISLSKPGTYDVQVEGDLTIHGVTNKVKEKGTLDVSAEAISATSKFNLVPEDYKIIIPGVVRASIAKTLEVTVTMKYTPLEKK